ncbi:hypothetical protein HAX54_012030 [Datura stramonium]|uniref:Galectin n=1 Tax=Datura stramonium TaxID=4076 RepID=A0ABS8TKZ2_DATST|nr:hypothetical protein [Datura stramonium]
MPLRCKDLSHICQYMESIEVHAWLGFAVPPPWFYQLRANRFGTMQPLGSWEISFSPCHQSSGAFEVYCNGELVFSKLKENRFPGELELKDLVGRRITNSLWMALVHLPES